MMFSMIFYVGACLVASFLLTVVVMMTRAIHTRDEVKSWRVMFWFLGLCLLGPYGYNEVLTRWQGPKMAKAIKAAYNATDIDGPFAYFKVTSYSGTKAKAIALGTEKQDWGGEDRPVVQVSLIKTDKGWKADSYLIVASTKRNKDGFLFPPYW